MRVVVASTQPDVLAAIRATTTAVLVARSTIEFEHESARAAIAYLDLRNPWVKDPLAVAQRALFRHPFLKLHVILNPLAADGALYFAFGQMGVASVVHPQQVSAASFWHQVDGDVLAFDAVDRFHRQVRPYLVRHEHPLLTLFLPNLHKASVKQLAQHVMQSAGVTSATKRRAVWATCQRVGLAPPEVILSGLRVLFIKSIVDDRSWTAEQLTRYLDFGSVRAMWRAVKRRTGLSAKQLASHDRTALFRRLTEGFYSAS